MHESSSRGSSSQDGEMIELAAELLHRVAGGEDGDGGPCIDPWG